MFRKKRKKGRIDDDSIEGAGHTWMQSSYSAMPYYLKILEEKPYKKKEDHHPGLTEVQFAVYQKCPGYIKSNSTLSNLIKIESNPFD